LTTQEINNKTIDMSPNEQFDNSANKLRSSANQSVTSACF